VRLFNIAHSIVDVPLHLLRPEPDTLPHDVDRSAFDLLVEASDILT
jgi:hypothetical protein